MTSDDDALDVVKCMACHDTVKGPAADIQARSKHWLRFGPAWLCDDCQEDDDTGATPTCISCGTSLGYIPPEHVRSADGWYRTFAGWVCGECRCVHVDDDAHDVSTRKTAQESSIFTATARFASQAERIGQ